MKLADEHDREFREKYGTDLDTALIFAGLFSAVSSAFIIQIQPLLVANVPTVIVVVQALQYISLFTALLAALLAVLGKQWIMYYNAAGSRGTIEERGLERQRKLDGLIKWKFEAVLQMFPLLLQLALLLFATSISVYLFTVHLSIAIIVAVLTLVGLGIYCFLLISATIYPDCPFQTPLTPLLVRMVLPAVDRLRHTIGVLNDLRSAIIESLRAAPPVWLLPRFTSKELLAPTPADPYSGLEFTPPSPEAPAVLWTLGTSTDPITISTAAELGLDLQWPARWDPQSTRLVTTRLADTFTSCFEAPLLSDAVRKGMEQIVVPCGRLFCTLDSIARAETSIFGLPRSLDSLFAWKRLDSITAEEVNLVRFIIHDRPQLLIGDWRQSATTRWLLYLYAFQLRNDGFDVSLDLSEPNTRTESFLSQFPVDYDQQPSLDLPTFANYLCCVCWLFKKLDIRMTLQLDKRDFRDALMTHFFQLLPPGFLMTPRILQLTAALNKRLVLQTPRSVRSVEQVPLIEAMLEFCSCLPRHHGWLDLVVSAASLTRLGLNELRDSRLEWQQRSQIDAFKLQPLYLALENVQQRLVHDGDVAPDAWDGETTLAIDGLLQALACNESLPANLSIESLTIILRALSASTDVAFTAYLLLGRAKSWFMDPRLQPVMQQLSVMHHLGRIALEYQESMGYINFVTSSYVELMQSLATIPEWRSALWLGLPTWMALFPQDNFTGGYGTPDIFTSVIRGVWVSEFKEPETSFASERDYCVALALTALASVWEGADASSAPARIVQLARNTVNTALSFVLYDVILPKPPMAASYSRLCASMDRAGLNIRTAVSTAAEFGDPSDTQHSSDWLAGFVEGLAKAIGLLFGPAQWDEHGLTDHRRDYAADRKRLEDMVDAAQEELKGLGNTSGPSD
ncbi:hypothetical protein C8R46DRAFT_1118554 [Mycena filopes]|nr:hypothetical protein C8R46DRAFT_1118554 [Mycena filopes]